MLNVDKKWSKKKYWNLQVEDKIWNKTKLFKMQLTEMNGSYEKEFENFKILKMKNFYKLL